MFISTVRFITLGWVQHHFVDTLFQFKYYGFDWVQMFPEFYMVALHYIMLLASVGIVLGAFYRFSSVVLFLTFSYFQLLDLTYYLNHYYFVAIVCMFMMVLPANKAFSFDVKWGRVEEILTVPAWSINIIKLQLAIVYIYAGLAKINYDWLFEALPLKIWLPAGDKLPIIGGLLALKLTPFVFSWIGMLYDTTIVFWLLYSKTRPWAYLTVIVFHIITGVLFQIGVFPMVMIGATLIFFSDGFHLKILSFLGYKQSQETPEIQVRKSYIKWVLIFFFSFQILFPWRYLLYPGNFLWTEQGYRFGWRVMLMEKAGTATFYVKDKQGHEGSVDNSMFLNNHQEKQMAMQPDMILQYAHFLSEYYKSKGMSKPAVRAEVYVTLNGRPSKLFIDPTIDLSKIKDGWQDKKWIVNRDNNE